MSDIILFELKLTYKPSDTPNKWLFKIRPDGKIICESTTPYNKITVFEVSMYDLISNYEYALGKSRPISDYTPTFVYNKEALWESIWS